MIEEFFCIASTDGYSECVDCGEEKNKVCPYCSNIFCPRGFFIHKQGVCFYGRTN